MKIHTPIRMVALSFFFFVIGIAKSNAQSNDAIAEQIATSFHEAIKSSDKTVCETYVVENYSKKFLEQHGMSKHVGMLERLHKDFSNSKITSVKKTDNKVSMAIERTSDKHKVTFELSVDAEDDYKVNGISVEAGEL